MTQTIERTPGDYSSLAPDFLRAADTVAVNHVDEADLIVTVCDKLVGLSDETKERLTEFLPADIALLRSQQDTPFLIEPFLAINLTEEFGIWALVGNFDQAYDDKKKATNLPTYWDKLKTGTLNRRALTQSVGQLSLRGTEQIVSQSGEDGLFLTDFRVHEQRDSTVVDDRVIYNPTDWLFVESMRREAGLPSLDRHTYTGFPWQMIGDSPVPHTIRANMLYGRPTFVRQDDRNIISAGVRFSKGLIPQPQA